MANAGAVEGDPGEHSAEETGEPRRPGGSRRVPSVKWRELRHRGHHRRERRALHGLTASRVVWEAATRCSACARCVSWVVRHLPDACRVRDRVASCRASRCHGRTRSSGSRWPGSGTWSTCHLPFACESRSSKGPDSQRARVGGGRVGRGRPRAAGASGCLTGHSLVVACGTTPSQAFSVSGARRLPPASMRRTAGYGHASITGGDPSVRSQNVNNIRRLSPRSGRRPGFHAVARGTGDA
jgi:hypothetical protein